MKLYTEEQVRKAIQLAQLCDHECGGVYFDYTETEVIEELTPIQLPNDEEMQKEADAFYGLESYNQTFTQGAKWMRDKLTQIEMKKQDITREQKLEYIAKLLAKAMYYGDWKWQTPNERVIELLMTDIGLYGFSSEDNMIAETGVPEELYTIAMNEIHTRREYVKHSVICYHGGKYTYDPDFFECHKCGGIVEEQYRIKQ